MTVFSTCRNLLVLIFLLFVANPSEASSFNLIVRLRELPTKKPIDAEVSISKGEITKTVSRLGLNSYSFQGTLGIEEVETYQLDIKPINPSHLQRSIAIKNDKYQNKVQKELVFYLVKQNDFNKNLDKYLNSGRRYFDDKEFDAALAHYEAPFSIKDFTESTNIGEYKPKLYYNYGRALYNTCISQRYEYDNCEQGIRIYQESIDFYGQYQKVFRSLGIEKDELVGYIKELRKKEFILKYQKISDLFRNKRYLEAANLAKEALKHRASYPKLFNEIGLEEDGLLKDAGNSYFHAAEMAQSKGARREKVEELLKSALGHLEKISTKDKSARQSIIDVKLRLRQL